MGRVLHINARLPNEGRRSLRESRVMCETGVLSDQWNRLAKSERSTRRQVTIIDVTVAKLIADGLPIELSGDNFFVDFDVSMEHVPIGSLLRVGSVTLQVSADTHVGGAKFSSRFGREALAWVNDSKHKHRRLRGILCTVVGPGLVCVGDSVQPIRGNELRYPNGTSWLTVRKERVVFRGENGVIEAEGYVVEGEQHGLWRYYRSTGALHLEGQYQQGVRCGRWNGYWASGARAWRMRYEKGKRTSGEFYTPAEARDPLLAEALAMEALAFDAFEPEHPVMGQTSLVAKTLYYRSTEHIASLEIVNPLGGVTQTRTWRESGEEIRTSPHSRVDGDWIVATRYHATGFRCAEERSRNGVLDGESSYWNDKGILEKLCVYEEGELKVTRHYTGGGLTSMSFHMPDGSIRVSEIHRAA